MKELYLNPEMNVVNFSVEDVITTSVVTDPTYVTTPGCDEGQPGTGFLPL